MTEETTPTILLGVTGGVAAYKSCELARTLMRAGFRVKVVMTDAATRFVTPLTFRALTGEPVSVSLWEAGGSRVHHISLAEEADVFAVAPCTANVIAKLAHGRADDLLTATALATEAPLVLAPAMNVHMWRDDATQENVASLVERGARIVAPEEGDLVCGERGEGRLADVEAIADEIGVAARLTREFAGVRMLVTAGGTREPLDPARHLGNRASGKTGFAVAEEAARRGASVILVTGPTWLADPSGVDVVRIETAQEMRDAVVPAAEGSDVLVMTAAVADYRPIEMSEDKIPKTEGPLVLELERTPDILSEVAVSEAGPLVVGFAAETGDPLARAREKLSEKEMDLIVANDVSDPALGFASDRNRVTLVTADAAEELPESSKRRIASVLLDRVATMLAARAGGDRES